MATKKNKENESMQQLELKIQRKSAESVPEIELMDNTTVTSPSWSYVQCDAHGNITANRQQEENEKQKSNDCQKEKTIKSKNVTNQHVGAFRVENVPRTYPREDDDDYETTSEGSKSDTKSETAKSELSHASSCSIEPSAPIASSVWYPGANDVLVAVAEPVPDYGYYGPNSYDTTAQVKVTGRRWCDGCCSKRMVSFLLIGTLILFGMATVIVMERRGVFTGIFSVSGGFEAGGAAPEKEGPTRSEPPSSPSRPANENVFGPSFTTSPDCHPTKYPTQYPSSTPTTDLSSRIPTHAVSSPPNAAVISFEVTNSPTTVATLTPTSIEITPTPSDDLPCLNWCHNNPNPWKAPRGTPQKCNWIKCAGCPVCATLSEAPTKSPSDDDDPPCFSWCDGNPNPWKAPNGEKQKCNWMKSCAGCSACRTLSEVPTQAPTEVPTQAPMELPCLDWCEGNEAGWDRKCGWFSTCSGCPECA